MSTSMHIVCPHCHGVNRVPGDRVHESPNCGICHRPLLDGKPVELTAENFQRHVERSDLPLVVDFWAPWCGPCKMMAPVFAQAAGQFRSKVRFAKVNTEEQTMLASQFGIRSIPTLALFRNGREVDRVAGAMDARNLAAWIERQL